MREVDSRALDWVNRVLGIGRPASGLTGPTMFDDGVLQQVFDVSGLIRRAQSPAPAEGIFAMGLRTVHTAADANIENTVDPYAGTATPAGGSFGTLYPVPMNPGVDLWILRATGFLSSGASANFLRGTLDLSTPPQANAYVGPGLALTSSLTHQLVTYDGTETSLDAGAIRLTQVGTGKIEVPIGIRVPRGTTIRFRTRNQNATAITCTLHLLMGLMASGLGQDVAV